MSSLHPVLIVPNSASWRLRRVRAVRILIGREGEAAVGVKAAGIGSGDGVDGGGSGRDQAIGSALGGSSEALFDLGEGQLDRVEVRGIGRQEEEAATDRLDGRAGVRALMGAQVVQDDDLARAEAGG